MNPEAEVREWVGTTPDGDDITVLLYDFDGDANRTALHILRLRYADMTANPAKWATADDYSQDTTANLAALATQIRRLEIAVGEPDGNLGWSSTPIVAARPYR